MVGELLLKIFQISDLEGYRNDFHNLFRFGFDGVDYKAEANEMVNVESIA
jgi:enoyl-[acyl-carrier protein] reductase/trans-2-enoyl-CoA reductase (NAD+)